MRCGPLACLGATVLILAAYASAADLKELQACGEIKIFVVNGNPYFVAFDPTAPPGFDREILESGKVTTLVDGVEDALLLQQADPAIQIGSFLGAPESLAFAVGKDSPQRRQALDGYLSNFRRTPSWNRLLVSISEQARSRC